MLFLQRNAPKKECSRDPSPKGGKGKNAGKVLRKTLALSPQNALFPEIREGGRIFSKKGQNPFGGPDLDKLQ